MDRRNFIRKSAFAGALAWTGALSKARANSEHASKNIFDVAIIGAGVFGSWTAYFLKSAGQRVLLLDAYGPSNDRASSGGETRIIRMGTDRTKFILVGPSTRSHDGRSFSLAQELRSSIGREFSGFAILQIATVYRRRRF